MHLFKVLLHVLLLVWCSTFVCSYCCLDCYTDGCCFLSVMCANLEFDIWLYVQSLLRGLLPDSFPARLAEEPGTEKQRRFIIIDEVVYATYGAQLEQVCLLIQVHTLCHPRFTACPSLYKCTMWFLRVMLSWTALRSISSASDSSSVGGDVISR